MPLVSVWIAIIGGILTLSSYVAAETAVSSPIQTSFSSYRLGSVRYEGITPGMIIGQPNWQVAEQVLPGEIARNLQAGDFTIEVQETTDLPVREAYISATEQQASSVSLDGGYKINNYQGGRPFPIIDPNDPRVGEKIAWNFRYRDMPDSMEMRGTMQGVNNAGTIDRSNIGRMRYRFGMHRVGEEENDLQWQEQGVYAKAMFESLAPSDQEGNMRITTLYDDENVANDELSYSPQNRRTRKSYMNMLSRMGGGRYDVLAEEQPPFFFLGYIHEYNWTYKGEQVMLVPGFLRADQLTFGGKNNWYPNVPWELRRVLILEVTPKGTHPYGRRVYFLDAQTYTPFYVLSYDPKGAFVRFSLIVHGNPDFSPGARGVRLPVPLGATWVNVVQGHASQMVAGNPLFKQDYSPRRFELMELLRRGK